MIEDLPAEGEAHQRDIRDRLQFEDDVALLARLAEQRETGGLARLGGERRIAQSALAPLGDDEARALARQIGQELARCRLHDSAIGNRQDDVLAVLPLAEVAHAGRARLGALVGRTVVREQGRRLRVDLEDHRTAVAPVTAVRTGERLELLTLDGGNAVPAVAAGGVNRHAIDEVCHVVS